MQTQQANSQAMDDGANVVQLRPPKRWHDPLRLVEEQTPSRSGRIVLWTVSALVLAMIAWAWFGQLDIIATANGKLVPQTLLKVVQPAESGVVETLLVDEGDKVKAGQVLARLNTTVLHAERTGVALDLATQLMQVRRVEAELADAPMSPRAGDDPVLYGQVQRQYLTHRAAVIEGLGQERDA
jgi:hemolysin D